MNTEKNTHEKPSAQAEKARKLDFDAHYCVKGWRGIAWHLIGYAKEWTEEKWEFIGEPEDDREDESNYMYCEPEEVEDRSRVVLVMVGDDRKFTYDIEDIEAIDEDDFCHVCGQIGCSHDGRNRD